MAEKNKQLHRCSQHIHTYKGIWWTMLEKYELGIVKKHTRH